MDKKNKNPNVPNLRFDFQSPWKTYKVDNIIESCGGGTPSTKVISYWQGDIPWISSSDLFENNIRDINVSRYVTKEAIKCSATKLCPKETICIVSRVGVGKVAVTTEPLCTSQDFMNITHFDGNKYFLAQLIQNKIKSSQLQGTSIKGITSKEIKDMRLFIPSRAEQDKIKLFLQKLDERIETQIKIIELKQSLIKGIEDRILWKTTNTQTKPIREFLTEINDKSIIQNQYPLLSSTKKGLFLQTDYFNKEAASSNNIGYKIVHKGDIIISPQNLWMGNITYNDKFDNGLVSPSYRIYKVKEEYNAFYISRILMSYRALSLYKNISEQGASIVRRNLNVDAFNELCFPIPNIKKQDEVGLFLSKLHQELNYETWILMQLKSQKNYLLNNMFI